MIFDASDNTFTNGTELLYDLIEGACTIFNSAMHENRPVVFAVGRTKKAQLLDYTIGNTWEGSKHDFRLIKSMYAMINCKKYHRLLLEFLHFCFNCNCISFFLLVSDLPTSPSSLVGAPSPGTGSKITAVALPTLTDDGVIVQLGQYFYQLNCNTSACNWETLEKELSPPMNSAVTMILPAEYTCE